MAQNDAGPGNMHPQTFLTTFWRMELRPHVFVAMSFDSRYRARFEEVFTPAITQVIADGRRLEPRRVDVSKTGDSILTDISDGIAHSRLVLGDVSSIGRDAVTGEPYRNANVLYEVGLALSCRHASEVLLVRDDRDRFLFDVSTVPHVTIDFTDKTAAVAKLIVELNARLAEQAFHRDARVQKALAELSAEEVTLLKQCCEYGRDMVWGREPKGLANWYALATGRLLDKGIIRLIGEFPNEKQAKPAFTFTPLGFEVKVSVCRGLRQFTSTTPPASDGSAPAPAEELPATDA